MADFMSQDRSFG